MTGSEEPDYAALARQAHKERGDFDQLEPVDVEIDPELTLERGVVASLRGLGLTVFEDPQRCARMECEHIIISEGYAGGPGGPVGFRCPRCYRTSWNKNDLRHGWCDGCKRYTTPPHGAQDENRR